MKNNTTGLVYMLILLLTCLALESARGQSLTYGNSFDVTKDITSDISASIVADPEGIRFSSDGLTLFILDGANDAIVQYELATAYSVADGMTNEGSYSVSTEEGLPLGFTFNNDGTVLYIVGAFDAAVNQYTLTNAFDITSGVSFDGLSASFSSDEDAPSAITFNDDGSKMYIAGLNSAEVHQYSLTTDFDVTDGYTSDGSAYDLASTETAPEDLVFSADGSKMFIIGTNGDEINQYSLTTNYDITSGVTADAELVVSDYDTEPNGLVFGRNGSRVYLVGAENDQVYELTMDIGGFTEALANDGSVEGVFTVYLSGETFTNTGSTLTDGTDYSISNLPAGLIPSISVAADGASATLSLSGNATNHLTFSDVSSLVFSFLDGAFVGDDASAVANASTAESYAPIDFEGVPTVAALEPFGVIQPLELTQYFDPGVFGANGLTFSNDGSRMFLVDDQNNSVLQFELTIPFDLSTLSESSEEYDVETTDDEPSDIAFSNDGLTMFISGQENRSVYQFSLSNPYDISSTVTYEGAYSVSTYQSEIDDVTFSHDGSTMFIVGRSQNNVTQFSLTVPFDITSGVTQTASFAHGEGLAEAVAFSDTGDKMFVIGVNNNLSVFDLSTPNAVATASLSHYVEIPSSFPTALAFNTSGTSLFVLDEGLDLVMQFDLTAAVISETTANDGTVSGAIPIYLTDDTFTSAGGTLSEGTHYTLTGIPSGLTASIGVAVDGTTASISFTGSALSNSSAVMERLSISFTSSAFDSYTAEEIEGASAQSFNVYFDFQSNPFLTYGGSFDVSDSVTLEGSLSIASDENTPYGIRFSNDGSKLFLVGWTGDDVNQYSLDVPYDITSTVTLDGVLDVSSRSSNPLAIIFSPDGKIMTLLDEGSGYYNYELETAFDITGSVSNLGASFVIRSKDSDYQSIAWGPDGTSAFLLGTENDQVYTFSVPVAYRSDVYITAADASTDFDISSQTTSPKSIIFGLSGYRMLILDNLNIYQYDLSNPFEPSTATFDTSYTLEYDEVSHSSQGMAFNTDGTKFFTCDQSSDVIRQYAIYQGGFMENSADDGSVLGSITISVAGDTFTNAGSVLTEGLNYTISGIPSGLTPIMTVSSDGLSVTLTLSGNATDHEEGDSVNDLVFTFKNSAFTNSDADIVIDAEGTSSNLGVTFITVPTFTSGTSVSVQEQTSGTIYTVATENNESYELGDNNDESWFTLTESELSFDIIPYYEVPRDSDFDNDYLVQIIATNSAGISDSILVTITVTDVIQSIEKLDQVAKIVASDRGNDDFFGVAVDISGDFAIVGAYGLDDIFSDTGGAYIYRRNADGSWSEYQQLSASDKASSDNFGFSVAISGTRAIVGAYTEDNDESGSGFISSAGSAYIYELDKTGTWTEVQKIVASDRSSNSWFGRRVSLSGNYAAVGAERNDFDATGGNELSLAGATYVFERGSTGIWTEVSKLVASDRAASDYFGSSVALDGNTLIVGAYSEDQDESGLNSKSAAGSAYIFERDGSGVWSEQQKITAPDRNADDNFGISVALSGSYAVVGARNQSKDAVGANQVSDAGSIYVFEWDGSDWTEVQKLVAEDRSSDDELGIDVSIAGDYILVGAIWQDQNIAGDDELSNAGAAYLYQRDASGFWSQKQKIIASDRETDDLFGFSVALSGDYGIVGALSEDEDASGSSTLLSSGSAYIFESVPYEDVSWNGMTSSDWAITSNWNGGILPTYQDNVIIPSSPNDPVIVNTMTVAINDLEVQSGASLTVESGGSLAIYGEATIDGTYQINRNTTGNAGYSVVSSPVENYAVSALSADYLYEFDGTSYVEPTGDMEEGSGYFVGYDAADPSIAFLGTPNTGSVSKSVTTGNFELVGNPYSAPVSVADFLTDNSAIIAGAVYFWDDGGTNVGGSRGGDYVTANALGAVSAVQPDGTDDGVDGLKGTTGADNGVILSAQGVYIEAIATGNVTFSAGMQESGAGLNDDANFYRKAASLPKIKLSISGDSFYDETLIGFVEDATAYRDMKYDAKKLSEQGLSTIIGEDRFAIQGLPLIEEQMHIPLLLEATAGTYDLALHIQGLSDIYDLYIRDLSNQVIYELGDDISVQLTTLGEQTKLLLTVSPKGVLSQELDLFQIMPTLSNIDFYGVSTDQALVGLYSLDGRILFSELIDFNKGKASIEVALQTNQLYIVKVGDQQLKFIINQ